MPASPALGPDMLPGERVSAPVPTAPLLVRSLPVRVATAAWGGLFLVAAAVNGALLAGDPARTYAGFAEDAYLAVYRRAWEAWFVPHPGGWILALVLFEIAVGAGILAGGRWRFAGLVASIAFLVVLVPCNAYTLVNLPLVGVPIWLLERNRPRALLDTDGLALVARRLRPFPRP